MTQVRNAIQHRANGVLAVCNMHTFNMTPHIPALARALSRATVFNDGLAIDVASSVLFGESFADNLNGTDLVPAAFKALEDVARIFFVGSQPGVAELTAQSLEARYPNVLKVGH